MSDRTSDVDSSQSPASGAQPVWNEDRAACWLANADTRERQLEPVSDALFERASLQPGERVLDVGVGSGPTTGQAWEAVRPDGSVTGIDIAGANDQRRPTARRGSRDRVDRRRRSGVRLPAEDL